MIGNELILKRLIAEILFDRKICESIRDERIVNHVFRRLFEAGMLVGEPLTIPELRALLLKRIVNFEFVKLDGEVRPATGTTNLKYIPSADHPKGVGKSSPKVATFYDLKKHLWRSVSQRSKEIVLKRDTPGEKPIVTISDVDPIKSGAANTFRAGKTYAYINRRGESGHTATVLRVGDKGYYLKLDVTGPVFYLTFDTANKRMRGEVKTPDKREIAPISNNRAVAKVKELINSPLDPNRSRYVPPLDVNDDNKTAYDVKDSEIKGAAEQNVLIPDVLPSPIAPEENNDSDEDKTQPEKP